MLKSCYQAIICTLLPLLVLIFTSHRLSEKRSVPLLLTALLFSLAFKTSCAEGAPHINRRGPPLNAPLLLSIFQRLQAAAPCWEMSAHVDRTESMRAGPPPPVLPKALPKGIFPLCHIFGDHSLETFSESAS